MYKSVPMDSDIDKASFECSITTCDLLKGTMTSKKYADKKLNKNVSVLHSFIKRSYRVKQSEVRFLGRKCLIKLVTLIQYKRTPYLNALTTIKCWLL